MTSNTNNLDSSLYFKHICSEDEGSFDKEFIKKFHNLLKENFSNINELDSLEDLYKALSRKKKQPVLPSTHLFLVIERTTDKPVAGCSFEHFALSNVCLLAYLAVDPKWREKRLSRWLVEHIHPVLSQHTQSRDEELGHTLSNLSELHNYEFLDRHILAPNQLLNSEELLQRLRQLSPMLVVECEGALAGSGDMDPIVRQKIYNKLGFLEIPIEYVQPALSKEQHAVAGMLLLVHSQYTSKDIVQGQTDARYTIQTLALQLFLWQYYSSTHSELTPQLTEGDPISEMWKSVLSQKDSCTEVLPLFSKATSNECKNVQM